MDEIKRAVPNGSSASYGSSGLCATTRAPSGSTEQISMSPPSTPVTHSSPISPLSTAGCSDDSCRVPKHSPFLTRAQHLSQVSELYYQDSAHSPFDSPQFQPGSGSFYPSTLHGPHKTCMARFLRSSNVPESSLPPSLDSPPSSFPIDRQNPQPPSSLSSGYPQHQRRDLIRHPTFHGQPPYGSLAPPHGVYAPLYDSRRVWRPQLYHREDARSNSLPPEVLHSSVYQPPLRERFNSLDSNYCSGAEHRAVHRDYGRVPLGYENLFRGKQEQWAHHHHHHHHNANQPSQTSPIFTVNFGSKHVEGRGSPCMDCRFRGEESLSHYSPWSCGSISPCLSSFEPESLTHTSAHSCTEHVKMNNESGCSVNNVAKPWLHSLDRYCRLKDEDPIIPFSEGPIISKWGAISRAARTGYHTTDPVQATACYGSASTTAINFRDYNSHLDHNDYKWNSRGSNYSSHSSFPDRDPFSSTDLRGKQTSVETGENLVPEQHTRHTGYVLDEERLCESESEPDRDIELELCALDMGDMDQQDVKSQNSESVDLASPQTLRLAASCPSPLLPSPAEEQPQTEISSPDKMDILLQKKMAFRKSISPSGLVSGGLNVGKLMLRAGPPILSDTSSCTCPEMPMSEVLLNGS
uniref:Ring finger and CCCH-type domains 2 n=1 Tax=Neogobius melanostomus TaxID=47308 RepID=A0A8C6UA44_9GOBI